MPVGERDLCLLPPDELFRLDGLEEREGLFYARLQFGDGLLRILHFRRFYTYDARDAVLRVVGDALYLHEEGELVENEPVVQKRFLEGALRGLFGFRIGGGFVEYLRKRSKRFHHRRDSRGIKIHLSHITSTRVPNNPPKQRRIRRHDALRRRRTAT